MQRLYNGSVVEVAEANNTASEQSRKRIVVLYKQLVDRAQLRSNRERTGKKEHCPLRALVLFVVPVELSPRNSYLALYSFAHDGYKHSYGPSDGLCSRQRHVDASLSYCNNR